VHPPPPPPPPVGAVEVRTVRVEGTTPEGRLCLWESEDLYVDGRPLWVGDPPGGEAWCEVPSESARMVEPMGHEGPFLSMTRTEWTTEGATTECLTVDVRTGARATLEDIDPERAAERWDRARGRGARRDAFVLRDGHVAFCLVSGDALEWVEAG
jgi:hypothetical protein